MYKISLEYLSILENKVVNFGFIKEYRSQKEGVPTS